MNSMFADIACCELYYDLQTLGPTIMSPHARQTGDTEAMRSHLTSQMEYMKKNSSGNWRPGFTPG